VNTSSDEYMYQPRQISNILLDVVVVVHKKKRIKIQTIGKITTIAIKIKRKQRITTMILVTMSIKKKTIVIR